MQAQPLNAGYIRQTLYKFRYGRLAYQVCAIICQVLGYQLNFSDTIFHKFTGLIQNILLTA